MDFVTKFLILELVIKKILIYIYMKNQFKNSIFNLPEVIKLLIIYLLINIGIICYAYPYLEDDVQTFYICSLFLLSFFILAFIGPVLVLYNNYENKTSNITLILEEVSIVLNDKIILVKDIDNITVYGTHQHFNYGGVSTLPYNDSFYYMVIETNKEKYYLTSLLSYNLDSILKEKYSNLKFNQQIKSFPLIK